MKLTVKLPNFTMTRGKVPAKGGGFQRLRRNFRKILLWGGLGLLFFLLFAWLSLPTRAIAWRIGHEAKAAGYLIDVEDVSISPFGGVTLENVRWTFEPSRPGQIPRRFEIPEVDIDVSILSLLVGNLDIELEALLDEGAITGRYYHGGDESTFELEIADVPLYGVPKAAQALNAPLTGLLAIKVDLTMPEHKFADATGFIELTCAACAVGDGEEKLYVPGSKAMSGGVVVPQIDMGTLSGRMTVEGGVATTDGPIETKSDDVWIEITGSINFKDPFGKSRFAMVLKFNLSETLQDASEPMRFMIQTAKPNTKLDPPEKGLGFKLEGPVSKPRFIGIKTKSRRESRAEKRKKQRERDERRRKRSTKPKKPKKPTDKDDKGKDDDKDKPTVGKPLDVKPTEPEESPREPSTEPTEEPSTEEPSTEEPAAADEGGNDEQPSEEQPSEEQPSEEQPAEDGGEGNAQGDEVEGEGGEGG